MIILIVLLMLEFSSEGGLILYPLVQMSIKLLLSLFG